MQDYKIARAPISIPIKTLPRTTVEPPSLHSDNSKGLFAALLLDGPPYNAREKDELNWPN